jgi:hypothetical protein
MRSFKLYLSLAFIFGLLSSCYTKEHRRVKEASLQKLLSANDSSLHFVKDDNGIYAEKGKIDSLMWILYAANFQYNAFYSEDKKMPKLRPVQCNLSFWKKNIVAKDTIEYYFTFFYKDPKVNYMLEPDFLIGVGVIDNVNRYMTSGYFKNKIPATPSLSKKLFAKQDSLFRNYLKTYTGEMSD